MLRIFFLISDPFHTFLIYLCVLGLNVLCNKPSKFSVASGNLLIIYSFCLYPRDDTLLS